MVLCTGSKTIPHEHFMQRSPGTCYVSSGPYDLPICWPIFLKSSHSHQQVPHLPLFYHLLSFLASQGHRAGGGCCQSRAHSAQKPPSWISRCSFSPSATQDPAWMPPRLMAVEICLMPCSPSSVFVQTNSGRMVIKTHGTSQTGDMKPRQGGECTNSSQAPGAFKREP